MGHEAIALWTEASSDPELIAGVRAGDTAAFGVLYERHVDAARKVASMYSNSPTDVEDVVSEAFSRVLRALQRGDGPDLAFRAYLFTIVRRTGMDIINKGIRTRPRDDMETFETGLGYETGADEPTLDGFEHGMVADAFRSLPERWQAVLWYTEVEKKSPKEIAPLLGLSANGVAALSYRAREALRQAYLQQHLNGSDEVSCVEANAQLGAYVRGGLNKREAARLTEHLDGCERCSALVKELEDVNRGMRGVIAPLVLGALGVKALETGLAIGGASGAAAFGTGASAAGAGGASGAASGLTAAGAGIGQGVGALLASAASFAVPLVAAAGVVAVVALGASGLGLFSAPSQVLAFHPTPAASADADPGAGGDGGTGGGGGEGGDAALDDDQEGDVAPDPRDEDAVPAPAGGRTGGHGDKARSRDDQSQAGQKTPADDAPGDTQPGPADGPADPQQGPSDPQQKDADPSSDKAVPGDAPGDQTPPGDDSLSGDDATTGENKDGAEGQDAHSPETTPEGHRVAFTGAGPMAAAHFGAPLAGCDPAQIVNGSTCADVMAFAGNGAEPTYSNDAWRMVPLNEAGGERNSASTVVELPEGAVVAYAMVEWAASRTAADEFDGPLGEARIRIPGDGYASLTADAVTTTTDPSGRVAYQARAEITELVSHAGAGEYTLADVAQGAELAVDGGADWFSGFAITVVYTLDSLPWSTVVVYDGGQWAVAGEPLAFGFDSDSPAGVTLGMVAWDGDRGAVGDQVNLGNANGTGQALTPRTWTGAAIGGSGDSGNAASSVAFGSAYANTLGVDAKLFQSANVGRGAHVLRFSANGDAYLVGTVTLTVTSTP